MSQSWKVIDTYNCVYNIFMDALEVNTDVYEYMDIEQNKQNELNKMIKMLPNM